MSPNQLQERHFLADVDLKPAPQPSELPADQAQAYINMGAFDFQTTQTIEPLTEIVGQNRAMTAIDLGMGVTKDGYNIFVNGLTGSGKLQDIYRAIRARIDGSKVPPDWVYVNNFDKPDEPIAVSLAPGKGIQFKKDMKQLVQDLIDNLSKAFRQEDFSAEKQRLGEKYNRMFQQQMDQLAGEAKDKGFEMSPSPQGGILFVPLIEGKVPDSSDAFRNLSDDDKKRIQTDQDQLTTKADKLFQSQHDLLHNLTEEVKQVEKKFGENVVMPIIDAIKQAYGEYLKIQKYLDRVAQNVLENLADFREGGKKQVPSGPMGMFMAETTPSFSEYQVNVLVDNSSSKGAPILVEESPTYRNLFGTVDRVIEPTGRMVTNFTQIKPGALLLASGGYLIFNLLDALVEPFVYKTLKRTLKSCKLEFETFEAWLPFSTGGLRPEPIPINTKVIVIGDEYLYYMLRFYDQDFASIFKVRADFGAQMANDLEHQYDYARLVAKQVQDESLLPYEKDAVGEIIKYGIRKSTEKDKLFARYSEIADIVREADYFARKTSSTVITADHVKNALKSKIYRSERIAEKIRELIANGTILISTDQSVIGQINGLAILDFGDFMFGRPSRVTVSLGLGSEGVINIEREAKLSGSTHDKGVLILAGYLRNTYGKNKPLALSASICFEQSYGGIDGDSASSTELFVLLATIADLPIRQDIAVTGSVNQWGQIQAIGAVNEKIEGFYDVCRIIGLNGRQGVCIPKSNVRNLMLRDDVKQAIADGIFHIYPIETVDQGLELLTGVTAGSADEEGTIHWLIDQHLRTLAEDLKNFGRGVDGARVVSSQQQAPPNMPPRLPDDQP